METSSIWLLLINPFTLLYAVAITLILRRRAELGGSFLPAALGFALLLASRVVLWSMQLRSVGRDSSQGFNPLGSLDISALGRLGFLGTALAWAGIALILFALLRLPRADRGAV